MSQAKHGALASTACPTLPQPQLSSLTPKTTRLEVHLKTAFTLAAALVAALSSAHAQADEVVVANSHYFQNWQFTQGTVPGGSVAMTNGQTNTNLSLAGRTLTVTRTNNVGNQFNVFGTGALGNWGTAIMPAGIDAPRQRQGWWTSTQATAP